MDNRIFNVNGCGEQMLLAALELAFYQRGEKTTCVGWRQTKDHGLILYWTDASTNTDKKVIPVCGALSAKDCIPMIKSWLLSDFAKTVTLDNWCTDIDIDGSTKEGWQVYCEDWGHIGNDWGAICAIRPAFMWYGK